MLPPKLTTINGATFELTLFGSIQGMKVLTELVRVLGPALGPAVSAMTGTKSGLEVAVLQALPELASRVRPDDLEYFVTQFAAVCTVHKPGLTKGPAPLLEHRDALWTGDYGGLFKWLAWCCKENFASFLPVPAKGGK